MIDLLSSLIATSADTSSTVPVAAVSSIISATLGALGAHFYKTAKTTDPQVYVTRKEFDDEVARLRDTIIEGERITQSRLDQVITTLGEVKGYVSAIKPHPSDK